VRCARELRITAARDEYRRYGARFFATPCYRRRRYTPVEILRFVAYDAIYRFRHSFDTMALFSARFPDDADVLPLDDAPLRQRARDEFRRAATLPPLTMASLCCRASLYYSIFAMLIRGRLPRHATPAAEALIRRAKLVMPPAVALLFAAPPINDVTPRHFRCRAMFRR